jgi:hypothetical protein
MKFITLKTYSKKQNISQNTVVINVDSIGHVYEIEKTEYGTTEKYTVVGTTCHNNGGFHVTNSLKEIIKLIND